MLTVLTLCLKGILQLDDLVLHLVRRCLSNLPLFDDHHLLLLKHELLLFQFEAELRLGQCLVLEPLDLVLQFLNFVVFPVFKVFFVQGLLILLKVAFDVSHMVAIAL